MRFSINQNKLIQPSSHGPSSEESKRKEGQSRAKGLPQACDFIAAETAK